MRKKYLYKLSILLVTISCCCSLAAQPVFFRQLGIKDGLNATSFWHTALDKNGFIWMASVDGLFLYDGYSVQHFTKETHPQLPSNTISYLYCDSRNRIWIQTSIGVAMIDENRRLHNINIPGYTKSEGYDRMVFEAFGKGYVAITPSGTFFSKDGINNWQSYTWLNSLLQNSGAVDIRKFDDHSQLLSLRNKRILLINFKEQKIILDYALPGVMGICRLNNDEILAGTDGRWGLYRISIKEKKVLKNYPPPKDKNGKELQSGVVMMDKASDGSVYISTRRNGLVRFNPVSENFDHFVHDATDEHSLTTNALRMVVTNDAGSLVITSPIGVNFTNVNYSVMKHQLSFQDQNGKLIDESINGVISDRLGNVFLTTPTKLLKWNRQSGKVVILRDISEENNSDSTISVPSCLEWDMQGNLWVGYNGDGIIIYSKEGRIIKHLKKANPLPADAIRVIRMLTNGQMMVGTENRLFMIHPKTYAADSFLVDTALQKISRKRIIDILPIGNAVWITASPNGGVFHYNFSTKTMKVYDEKKGLGSGRAYCLAADRSGNIYAGTRAGLSIIDTNGKITNLDKSNGLLNTRVESMETDDSGFVWFTNNNNLSRYDPWQKKLSFYNEHNGISNTGFGVESSYKSPTGELFFGTSNGLLFFNPDQVKPYKAPLQLYLYRTVDGKNFIRCDKDSLLEFAYKEGKIIFQVSASDIISNQQLFYRYKLEGLDADWSEPTHTRSIAYNLRPGKYRFSIQASYDRINYLAVSDIIKVNVAKPFWQTLWFVIPCFLLIGFSIWWLFRNRIQSIRKKSEIQQQMVELEAKALRAQMNPHFIFNSLNAIQECIVTEKTDAAFEYLSKFSRLLRLVLNSSEKNLISLSSELEMIRLYLSLESLRFRQSFSYYIEVEEAIDTDEIQVPSLLIQPFVENAVWHGLRMKEGEKKLWLRFMTTDQHLIIEIEDNGIGREKAAAIKKQKLGAEQFESKGTTLSQQRIELLNRQQTTMAKVEIIDLPDAGKQPGGTKVIIQLPFDTQKLIQSKPFEHAKNTDR